MVDDGNVAGAEPLDQLFGLAVGTGGAGHDLDGIDLELWFELLDSHAGFVSSYRSARPNFALRT
jgi:hypothetical protein